MAYLEVLGVPTEVEDLWSRVRRQGPQQAAALSIWARDGELDELLRQAAEIGLMSQLPSGEWEAVPAAEAFSAAKAWRDHQAESAAEALLLADEVGGSELELMVGMDEIREYQADALRRCTTILQGFDVPPYGTPHRDIEKVSDPDKLAKEAHELQTLLGGCRTETIYDPAALEDPVKRQEIKTFIDAGEIAKVGPAPMKLMIFDRRELMMSILKTYEFDNPQYVQAVHTDHPAVVAIATSLWDRAWERATPYPYGPHQNNFLAQVAECTVAALTVEEMAKQLQMSTSQIRRYKAQLRTMLGAKTEAQLGYLLATDGLSRLADPET